MNVRRTKSDSAKRKKGTKDIQAKGHRKKKGGDGSVCSVKIFLVCASACLAAFQLIDVFWLNEDSEVGDQAASSQDGMPACVAGCYAAFYATEWCNGSCFDSTKVS